MMLVFSWEATQSYVKRVYSKGLSTQPWGVPVLTVLVSDVRLPTLTDWGLPERKFSTQLQRAGVRPRVRSFSESLCGMTVLNAEVKSMKRSLA